MGGDTGWQQHLRLLQALWREEQELPIGLHRGRDGNERPLRLRIAMPQARDEIANYSRTASGRW